MTRRTKKIGKVVSLAASEERRFGEQAGQSQQKLDKQLKKLGELNAYRQDYASKNPATAGTSAAHWKDFNMFLHRLDQAVTSQQHLVTQGEQNLESHRKRWLAKRQKLESLQRILDKSVRRDAIYLARLEQKLMDDLPNAIDSILKPRRP
jgi:flagellar FliJ protein